MKHSGKVNPRKDADDMRERINRLENSILSMINSDGALVKQPGQPPLHVTDEADIEENPDQAGGQKMSLDTRSTHWDAILNDVSKPPS